MSARGRKRGSYRKVRPQFGQGTPKIDSIFRRIAREQTQELVVQDTVVNNDDTINETLNQLRANTAIRNTINNTRQTKFVINPINMGQLGIPGTFGGSDFGVGFKILNDSVNNTNVVALNVNSQKKRINKPDDIIDLDPDIVQSTIESNQERPSDVQLLSSALSDGQSAVVEMIGLNLEQLLENNPILLDLIGQPQLNFEQAVNAYLNQIGVEQEQPIVQSNNNNNTVENNTNVIVPILEQNLNTQQVEMDLEAQLNKPVLNSFTFASMEEESQGDAELWLSSQVYARSGVEFGGIEAEEEREEKNNQSSRIRLSQSSNSISSPQAQLQFDRYMDQLFPTQSPSSSQTRPLEPFLSQGSLEATERIIDLDFDYVHHYLSNVTANVLPPTAEPISPQTAMSWVRELPIINRYLAPSPNAQSQQLERSTNSNVTRVRIRRPQGLSSLSSRQLTNRRRTRRGRDGVDDNDNNLPEIITISGNTQLELIRERLRRLVSRVAANSVEMDQSSNMQVESPINLLSSSLQLPSQFEFEK